LFRDVGLQRLRDAVVLFRASRFSGSMYLFGYAIECALKWAVTVRRNQIYLAQGLEIHNWDTLLDAAGLRNSLDANPALKAVYSTVADTWRPALRYSGQIYSISEARELHNHFKIVYDWITETII
jgi:hypothetical protein